MLKNKLKIVYVPIGKLQLLEKNPRIWSEKNISDLTKSIQNFSLVEPILVNMAKGREFRVIGGNFRLSILQRLKYKEVPCIFIKIDDLKKERELALRLNRNLGQWDLEMLREFDIELLMDVGFDDLDLLHIWDENLSVEDDEFNVERELEKIKTPQTKPGDIFELGNHKLACLDSTDPTSVKRITQGRIVDMLYCDPPFNIGLNYNKGIGGKGTYGGDTNDKKSNQEYKEFLTKTVNNGLSIAKNDCHVFYYCDESYIGLLQEIYREMGINHKRVCLWVKNNSNMTPQIAFNKCYEAVVYGVKGKPYLSKNVTNLNEILNKEITNGNRLIDDILDLFNIWLVKRLPTQEYNHPTEKPPTLHEKALRRCTKVGDVVLDLFAGSGSTMIACEQIKRKCLMVEKEPIFCDLIINRYKALNGKDAKKL